MKFETGFVEILDNKCKILHHDEEEPDEVILDTYEYLAIYVQEEEYDNSDIEIEGYSGEVKTDSGRTYYVYAFSDYCYYSYALNLLLENGGVEEV